MGTATESAGGPLTHWTVPPEVGVLEFLCEAHGLPFDRPAAEQALDQSAREYPGTTPDSWESRLRDAGGRVGLRFSPLTASARAVSLQCGPDEPVVGFAPDEGWLLLTGREGGRVRVAPLPGEEPTPRLLTPDELARSRGAASADEPLAWLVPCQSAAANLRDPHHDDQGHAPDEHHAAESYRPLLRRLGGLLRPEAGDLWTVFVFAVGVGVLSLATPIIVSELVNSVIFSILVQQVLVLAGVLLVCLGIAAAMQGLQVVVVEYLQQRLFVRVVADFAHRIPRVRLDAWERTHGPELVNRFFDILTVQKSAAALLLDGTAIFLQTSIGMLVLAFYHPYLLGFDIVLIALVLFAVFVLGRGAVRTSVGESLAKYKVAAWLEELARHQTAFKMGGGADHAWNRADHLAREYLSARRSHFRIVLRQVCFALALQVVASVALLGLGGWLVIDQQLTVGQLVAAELIVTLVVSSFAKMGKYIESYYDLLAAVDKLGHVTDLPLERDSGDRLPPSPRGAAVDLHDVTFAPDGGRSILHYLFATIPAGARVALQGPPGAGKSVLVDLLYGLREPTGGHVRIDGVDLRGVRLDSLRQQVGLARDPEVFDGTIAENLRMGRAHLTMTDLREALRAVGLLDDVRALPGGVFTQLTTNGKPLSLTQALRLALARVLLGRPRLLIIDGLLDFLDLEKQGDLIDHLFDPKAPWTLVLVTRLPELVRRCDHRVMLARPSAGEASVGFEPPADGE